MPLPEHLRFIGLSNMGGPIALRLLRAGFAMTVLDLDPEKMPQLLQEGASTATAPTEVAQRSTIVFAPL
jgi:3-hydroxyisobutyrate dehydrogenase